MDNKWIIDGKEYRYSEVEDYLYNWLNKIDTNNKLSDLDKKSLAQEWTFALTKGGYYTNSDGTIATLNLSNVDVPIAAYNGTFSQNINGTNYNHTLSDISQISTVNGLGTVVNRTNPNIEKNYSSFNSQVRSDSVDSINIPFKEFSEAYYICKNTTLNYTASSLDADIGISEANVGEVKDNLLAATTNFAVFEYFNTIGSNLEQTMQALYDNGELAGIYGTGGNVNFVSGLGFVETIQAKTITDPSGTSVISQARVLDTGGHGDIATATLTNSNGHGITGFNYNSDDYGDYVVAKDGSETKIVVRDRIFNDDYQIKTKSIGTATSTDGKKIKTQTGKQILQQIVPQNSTQPTSKTNDENDENQGKMTTI